MPRSANYIEKVATAASIDYNNRVYEMKEAGEDIITLSLGEAFFDIPLFAFDDLPMPDIYHYSHSRGTVGLRTKLATHYGEKYGVPVDPSAEIVVTAGAKIALYMSFMALLEPGDAFVVPEPAWVSYSEQIRLCHGEPLMVPYGVPVEDWQDWITPAVRGIVVCSPQNPTGRVYSRAELQYLHDLVRERDIYLLADESYSEFLVNDEYMSCGVGDSQKTHTIICNSMSKNYGISGWRIGYVIANHVLTNKILKINQHLITCPPTILEHYLERHFDDLLAITRPQIRETVEERARTLMCMDELGLGYMPGTATFYIFASIGESCAGSVDFCDRLLADRRVSVVPGVGYGLSCDKFVRISVGAESPERIREGLRAIKELTERPASAW